MVRAGKTALCLLWSFVLAVVLLPCTAFAVVIEEEAFADAFEYTETEDGITITNYVGAVTGDVVTDIAIPAEIDGKPVVSIGSYVFEGNDSLKNVVVPEGVTSIGDSAFLNCGSLQSIDLPSTLVSIERNAFAHCVSLESIVIPEGVTKIGNEAFYGCSSLMSVTLPSTLTTISSYSFGYDWQNDELLFRVPTVDVYELVSSRYPSSHYQSAFVDKSGACYLPADDYVAILGWKGEPTSLSIPSEIDGLPVTTILPEAFQSCNSLTSVTIPSSVLEISERSFQWCDALVRVTVSEGTTSIGDYAFNGCKSLANIAIPKSVVSIGECAFQNCWSLRQVSLPSTMESIGVRAFAWCGNLASTTIPEGVVSIEDGAFQGCSSLFQVTLPSTLESIGEAAFYGCTSLVSIAIPEGVSSIEDGVFQECESLARVTIPESVTSVGDYAFSGCTNLTGITIPEGTVSIGAHAFQNCSSLFQVALPSTLESIGAAAFSGCTNLAEIAIPEGVTSIEVETFRDCSSLANVSIPKRVTSIGAEAFFECLSFESVYLPESVTSIGDSAFYGCASLESVTMPSTLSSIGQRAFYNCDSLKNIVIPEGVVAIEGGTFAECSSLQSVSLPSTLVSIGSSNNAWSSGAFAYCHSLERIVIPEGVESIGGYAFYDCSSLWDIIIPSTVTSFGGYAFSSCDSLEVVFVPEGVAAVGNYAFQNCSSLQSVSLPSTLISIGSGAFQNCSSLESIAIPEGTVTIRTDAFSSCRSMGDMVLPESLISIGANAFTNFAKGSVIRVATQDQYDLLSDRSLYLTPSRTTVVLAGSEIIDGVAVTTLALDAPCDVALGPGEFAYFSYTAPRNGFYQFWTSGDEGAVASLSRGDSKSVICEDDETTCFYGSANLQAGQTVYLKVFFDDGSVIGTVRITASQITPSFASYLPNCNVAGIDARGIEYTGEPVALCPFITTLDWAFLREGTDYAITYFSGANAEGEPLAGPPSDPGTYSILISAIEGGYCSGSLVYEFEIYDLGLLSAYSVKYQTYPSWLEAEDMPGYLYTGEEVEPDLYVVRSGIAATLRHGIDYRVSYENNIGSPNETTVAAAVITGLGEFEGQTLESLFAIFPSLEVGQWLEYCGAKITHAGTSYYTKAGEAVEFLYSEAPTVPIVSLLSYQAAVTPRQGVDYSVSYEDASGNAVQPVEPGSYNIVVKALEGGILTGGARIPFEIIANADISEAGMWLKRGWISDSFPSSGSWAIVDALEDFVLTIHDMGRTLVEGLDYIVSTAWKGMFDEVYDGVYSHVYDGVYEDVYDVTVSGLNSYTGSSVEFELITRSPQSVFENNVFVINGQCYYPWAPNAYDTPTVYVTSDWTIVEPSITTLYSGLTYGTDFAYAGVYDWRGIKMTKLYVGAGTSYTLKLAGVGAYEGCEVEIPVYIGGRNGTDLSSSANAGIKISEAVVYHGEDGFAAALLKGLMPSVSVKLYYQHALLGEGEGFESSINTSEDGSSAVVTVRGIPSMGYTGTATQIVKLVDSYDMSTMLAGSYVNGKFVDHGEEATLLYSGFDYQPAVTVASIFTGSSWDSVGGSNELHEGIDYTLKLFNEAGNAIGVISDAGFYTMVLEGMGNWSGTYEIPVNVVEVGTAVDLQSCTIYVAGASDGSGSALLRNGICEPAVSVFYGDYQLIEGQDYTLSYGNNERAGNAYVTATAVSGGNFQGAVSCGFRVCETLDLEKFATLAYRSSSGEIVPFTDFTPTVTMTDSAAELDVVVLTSYDEATGVPMQSELASRYYSVEMGANDKAGMAWVKVTGKNGYEGMLSANFNVVDLRTDASEFAYSVAGGKVTITGYEGAGGAVYIPSEIGGCPVTTIGSSAFKENASVTKIGIPSTITSIGENAFAGCSSVSSLTIPESVTFIAKGAFLGFANPSAVFATTQAQYDLLTGEKASNYVSDYTDVALDRVIPVATASTQEVTVGSAATFTCEVKDLPKGVEVGSYQWYFSDDGETWYASGASGAKTETMKTPALAERAGRQFYCLVALSDGTQLASNEVCFEIADPEPAPDPTIDVSTTEVLLGDTATFRAEVKDLPEGASVAACQWQFSDDGKTWYDSGASGSKTDSMSTPALESRLNRQFRCKAILSDGVELLSEAVGFALGASEGTDEAPAEAAAEVSTSEVSPGTAATFTCKVTSLPEGASVAAYQWQFSDDGKTWYDSGASGAKTGSMSTPTLESRANRQFRCVVTLSDANKLVSEVIGFKFVAVKLEVAALMAETIEVAVGERATFTAKAEGLADGVIVSGYQWQFSDDGKTWYDSGASGAKTESMSTPALADRADRVFRCTATLSDGTKLTSEPIGFELSADQGSGEAPEATARASTSEVALGTEATFTCEVVGLSEGEAASYQWQFSDDGKAWKASSAAGAKTDIMTTAALGERAGRLFRCLVTLSDGTKLSTEPVGFSVAATAATATADTAEVALGATATFTCEVDGLAEDVKVAGYYWIFSDDGFTWTKSGASGADTEAMSTAALEARLDRQFRCVVDLSDGTQLLTESIGFMILDASGEESEV